MSEQLLNEVRYPLTSGEKLGVKRSFNTFKSWHENGLKSRKTGKVVKLEAMYEGSSLVTSKEAVKRFLARLNGMEV